MLNKAAVGNILQESKLLPCGNGLAVVVAICKVCPPKAEETLPWGLRELLPLKLFPRFLLTLPFYLQRRRTVEDELNMRTVFKEDDLISVRRT